MFTTPRIESRPAQPYVALHHRTDMESFGPLIPVDVDAVAEWLAARGITPSGPPLVRYHMCPNGRSSEAPLEVSIGFPTEHLVQAPTPFVADVLPAGDYATLVFTGIENGYAGNAALIEWAANNGHRWDCREVEGGEHFPGRMEFMIDGPEDDPDPAHWRTEVAIKLADR